MKTTWYSRNRQRALEYQKEYNSKHRNEITTKRRKINRERYLANPQAFKDRATEHKLKSRAFVRAYKASHGCSRCPETHPACLDFHHINPETKSKLSNGTRAISYMWSIKRIKLEILKCIILCANCHRKEHFKDYNLPI